MAFSVEKRSWGPNEEDMTNLLTTHDMNARASDYVNNFFSLKMRPILANLLYIIL